jgi:hypothetical protein
MYSFTLRHGLTPYIKLQARLESDSLRQVRVPQRVHRGLALPPRLRLPSLHNVPDREPLQVQHGVREESRVRVQDLLQHGEELGIRQRNQWSVQLLYINLTR